MKLQNFYFDMITSIKLPVPFKKAKSYGNLFKAMYNQTPDIMVNCLYTTARRSQY